LLLSLALLVTVAINANAQTPPAAPAQGDVYHVSFSKAALGEAGALGDKLRTPDPKAPSPGHFVVLRHQHGDDWDYCVIEHLGPKATVEIDPASAPNLLRAWHEDTFVAGPAWAEFARAMGLGEKGPANGIYVLSMWRAAAGAGHREALEKAMGAAAPGSKAAGNVLLQHLEGGAWQYLGISRYASWQDFAADQGAPGSGSDAWAEVRKHGSFHRDTIADRLPPK
jgi:hypothetical protein